MELPPVLLDPIVTALQDIQWTRYSELSSSTIIVYDYCITFDQEVDLIWGTHWGLAKCLFLVNRYYGMFTVILNNYGLFSTTLSDSLYVTIPSGFHKLPGLMCLPGLHWFRWQGWTALIACMAAESILQMRLYALYFLNKRILIFMMISFVAACASAAAIMGTVLANFTATAHVIPGFPFCIPFGVSRHFYAFWIPILSFESLLCSMALYRGFETFKARATLFKSGRHVVTILIRDSIIYFLIMFATYLTNLLFWSTGSVNMIEIPAGFSVAMSSVIGNRLVLNIRQLNRDEAQTTRKKTSSLRFPRPTTITTTDGTNPSGFTSTEQSAITDLELAELSTDQEESKMFP